MKKVLVVGDVNYASFLRDKEYTAIKYKDSLSEIDNVEIIIFTGGEDVSPSLYGVGQHFLTQNNRKRDELEERIFRYAITQGKFLIGVCRGAQFLTVMNRGKLVQHVNNHATSKGHEISTKDGNTFHVTSTHHQMMMPYNTLGYEVLAVAKPSLSDLYFKNNHEFYKMKDEPEIVWYKKNKSLAIQPHPEMMSKSDPFITWINETIDRLYEESAKSKSASELDILCDEFDSMLDEARVANIEREAAPMVGRRRLVEVRNAFAINNAEAQNIVPPEFRWLNFPNGMNIQEMPIPHNEPQEMQQDEQELPI